MNNAKKILLNVLGEEKYLSLLANTFQAVYKTELPGKDYQDVYFLKKYINEGDYCADIGAHLGYYACELSRLVKNSGKVIAIEPMSKFNQALKNLLKKKNINNVELLQVAMGGDSGFVEMGIPKIGNAKKFAHARVMKSSTHLEYIESEKVKNENGDDLFQNLPRLDFIKCDVEGLELAVFSSMKNTLQKHHPILLCELGDMNERRKFYELVSVFGYKIYVLENKKFYSIDVGSQKWPISHNHYFISPEREEKIKNLIGKS